MTQLSLFSADLVDPQAADLGGLLAAHGQVARAGGGARVSILLDAAWRADALLAECRMRDIDADAVAVSEVGAGRAAGSDADVTAADPVSGARSVHAGAGRTTAGGRASMLLRTGRIPELLGLADAWSRGAVKAVPAGLALGAGLLRCWTLAAGRPDPAGMGFLLGLDPHAEQTHEPLAAACARAGVAGSILGVRAGGPAIRVVGHRRVMRLAELLGTPPPGAPSGCFPSPDR